MAFLYRDTDVGSPGKPDNNDSYAAVKAVFVACLVNGYGTGDNEKPKAGWTVAFEDAAGEVFVLQNSAGHYFRFSRDGATNGSYRHWHVTSYRTMTDANTGTGAGKPGKFGFRGSGTCKNWWLMADGQGFYLQVKLNSSDDAFWYIGPLTLNPFEQGFDGIITAFGSGASSGYVIRSGNQRGVLYQHHYYRYTYSDTTPDGIRSVKQLHNFPAFPFSYDKQLASQNGHLIGGRFWLGADNLLIGHYPGLLLPANTPLNDDGEAAEQGDIITVQGKPAMMVKFNYAVWEGSIRQGKVLVELENWHG